MAVILVLRGKSQLNNSQYILYHTYFVDKLLTHSLFFSLSFKHNFQIFLNLEGFAAGVLLIQSCMPSAVLTYLVGSMYSPKRVVDSVASVIVSSTVMSFVTIPIVVFYSIKYLQ